MKLATISGLAVLFFVILVLAIAGIYLVSRRLSLANKRYVMTRLGMIASSDDIARLLYIIHYAYFYSPVYRLLRIGCNEDVFRDLFYAFSSTSFKAAIDSADREVAASMTLPFLDSDDRRLRVAAAVLLGWIGSPIAARALATVAGNPMNAGAIYAFVALNAINPDLAKAVQEELSRASPHPGSRYERAVAKVVRQGEQH